MLTNKYRFRLALFLVLMVLPTTCNRNKKYVKGEIIGAEDLWQQQAKAVEGLHLMPPAEGETQTDREKSKPRAVVQGLERGLIGSGAHREVRSEIALELLDFGLGGREMSVSDDCELILLESLSNGFFADPFQLNRLQQQRGERTSLP